MTTTNVSGIGNFYVKSKDPAGPWSDPIPVAQQGIDPSSLFDDDGRVYFQTACYGDEGEGIYQCEIDIASGKKLTESRLIWRGTGEPVRKPAFIQNRRSVLFNDCRGRNRVRTYGHGLAKPTSLRAV